MKIIPVSLFPRANFVVGPSAEYLTETLFMNHFDNLLLSTTQVSQVLGRVFLAENVKKLPMFTVFDGVCATR